MQNSSRALIRFFLILGLLRVIVGHASFSLFAQMSIRG